MALFKPFRGSRASLDAQPLHDGYAYFCTDDGSFHIDFVNENGILQRKQVCEQEKEVYAQNDEPQDATEGALWVDLDANDASGKDVIFAPNNAKVGQTIVVTEVDDNGKPIAWEAANIRRYSPFIDNWGDPIATLVTKEEVTEIKIPVDDDYREILVNFIPAVSSTATDRFMKGYAWIGNGLNGGSDIEFDTAHTNGQIFPSLWYAGRSGGNGAVTHETNSYIRYVEYIVNGNVKHSVFNPVNNIMGAVGFRVPSGHYFGIGTTVKVWGRK